MVEVNNKEIEGKKEEKETIVITPEMVVVNLINAFKRKDLPIAKIYQFLAYLRKKMRDNKIEESLCYDVDKDTIERMIYFNNMVYDCIVDTIIVKGILPTLEQNYDFLEEIAKEFVRVCPI